MCEHETLQYQWMRYLPSTDGGHAWGSFWTTVIDAIKTRLGTTPVLRPASLGPLRQIREMRMLTEIYLDQNGRPLFADILPEKYLSPGYAIADLKILASYGLSIMFMKEVIMLIEHDLQALPSRMKSCTSKEWHDRAAMLLQVPFKRRWKERILELRNLKLLPLRDSRWISINDDVAYYPDLNGMTIPDGLKLSVIDKSAAKNPERRAFFDLLGVKTATIDLVRDLICQRYRQTAWSLPLRTSLDDLRFLYLTHDAASRQEKRLAVSIITNDGEIIDPTWNDVYLTSDDHLGASELLAPTPPGPDLDDGAPGHPALFIDDIYLSSPPSDPPATLPTWTDWLHDTIHIRRHVRLKDKSSDNMSDILLYVSKHRPVKFLSLLNELWQLEDPRTRQNETLIEQLRSTEVLCKGGRFYELTETFLPTSYNEELANRFLVGGDPFRWLQLDSLSGHACQPQEWEGLTTGLGFGLPENDLEFGLSILDYMEETQDDEPSDGSRSLFYSFQGSAGHRRVHDLYVFLEAQVRGSRDEELAREVVE